MPESLAKLRAIVGADAVSAPTQDDAPWLIDHRALYRGAALAIVRPRDVATVQRLLAYCNERRIGIVPQGGNTSYCGGATPDASGEQILLSLARLQSIREVDAVNYSLTAEAGCVLADVQRAARDADRFFPLALGSEGSCQIGGNLSTNAGGLNVLRYGMTRDLVLGLEVVLPDGRMLSTLQSLRKDNTGYDVKSLFVGAEGTLGVITAAALKLFPQPRAVATAFLAVPTPAAAVALLDRLRAGSGDRVASFELIPRIAIELTRQFVPDIDDPLTRISPWYVLCELTSASEADALEVILATALERASDAAEVSEGVLAQNERQRTALWRLRESIPEAQRAAGASLKHDISLPISELARFVDEAGTWIAAHIPSGVLVAYGHVGDGNLHFNVNQRAGCERHAFLTESVGLQRYVHDRVRHYGGSFSAEHGIGQLKVEELERYADPVELELMRRIKSAFDPNGIMNPGKVLRRR